MPEYPAHFSLFSEQRLACPEDIACAHGNHHIALPDIGAQVGSNLRQGFAEYGARYFFRQMGGGNADGVALPGGITTTSAFFSSRTKSSNSALVRV